MSFGKWHEQQKQAASGGESSSIGGLGSSLGSLFASGNDGSGNADSNGEGDVESQSLLSSASLNQLSLSSMRSSLEAQLPQKIMGLNYQQRFQIFCICLLLSALFFALGFFVGIPMLTIRPQKFALSFTCGSITFMSSFAILKGPADHFQSMIAGDRIHFTVVYVGSMLLTLYFTFTAGGAKGYLLVMGSSALQLVALLWYLITFLPGGAMGMKVLTQAIWKILKPFMMGCAKMQAVCVGRCVSWYASRFTSSS